MKNIWKFLMVAMMAIAMVGCPQPGNNNGNEGGETEEPDNRIVIEYPATANTATSGIYEVKIPGAGVSLKDWGADNERATIKVVFVTKAVAQKIIDGDIASDSDLFTDDNNTYVYCNNAIGNGMVSMLANGATNSWVRPAAAVETKYEDKGVYEGVLVSKADADGNYTALINVNKIRKNQLLWKGGAEVAVDSTTDHAAFDNSSDIVNRIPLVLGSVSFNQGKAKGVKAPLAFWSAAILFGEPSTKSWPTTGIKNEVPRAMNFGDLTHVCGGMDGWAEHQEMTKGVIEFSGEVLNGQEFKITCGNWSYSKGGFDIKALNQEYSFDGDGNGKVSVALDATKTYEIHYKAAANKQSGIVWICEKGYTGTITPASNTPAGDDSSSAAGDNSSSAAGDNSSSGAGDNSSSGAGAGDNGSSGAGAGDNGSSGASTPVASVITVTAPTGKTSIPAAITDVSNDTTWTQVVTVDTTSASKTKHVANFFGEGKDLDLTSDAIVTFTSLIDNTSDNKVFGKLLGDHTTDGWNFAADAEKVIVLKIDLSNIKDVTIDENTTIVNNFSKTGFGWTKQPGALFDGESKSFYYICSLTQTQLAKDYVSFITFQIVNDANDETKNSKVFAYALVSAIQ